MNRLKPYKLELRQYLTQQVIVEAKLSKCST